VVKISFPSSEPVPEIERQLTERGRAEVYDIYFDFAKATLRPESSSVLQQIAAALGRHPSWRVSIQGHTDGIGNDQDNQLLSEHRAEVVRRTLAEDYRISAERLSIEGRGESQPKDTNETLSGRARNRRVELVRY
jgi:outer membrane protein OmpA-like peptidoglycan-associated protein